MTDPRPRRSVLYLPASNARAIEKALTLPADVVILDLEDAVAPELKEQARAAAMAASHLDWGARELAIRVNGLATPWAKDDFAAVAASAAQVLVVPKINDAADAGLAVDWARGLPVWPLIETPRAVQQVDAIADTQGVAAMICGFADLAKDLRARPGPDRLPLLYAASRIVNAARASDILAFDGVWTDVRDPSGLAAEAAQALSLGFDGKTCIHPNQLEAVNAAFTPTAEEIADARALIATAQAAAAEGKAVSVHNGKLVEALHVAMARRVLGNGGV